MSETSQHELPLSQEKEPTEKEPTEKEPKQQEPDHNHAHWISILLEEQKTEGRKATAALKEAKENERLLQRLQNAERHGRYAEIVHIFNEGSKKESDLFKKIRKEKHAAVPLYESLCKEAKEQAKNTVWSFSRIFPKACNKAGIEIDSTSQYPEYSIKEFIQITIDKKKFVAKVKPRDAKTTTIPLDIDPLVEHLCDEIKRLFETKRDLKRFLSDLHKTYQLILKEEKRPPGDELPIRRVAKRFSKNKSHFRCDEFNVDLGKLILSQKTVINSARFNLDHTRDTKDGMLLFGLEDSGYMGFIGFKKECP